MKKQESETSTFGMKQFRNIHTDQIQTPILNDYSPKGSVSLSVLKDYEGNTLPVEDTTTIKVYVRVFKTPNKEGIYFTDHGFLTFSEGHWTDANRMGYNDINSYYKEVILNEMQLICLESSL